MSKRLRTDLLREIRVSLPRFLSILLMVGLGVMFLVGLRSAAPDMRATADAFFDAQGLFDLQLFSTLGFDAADLAAVSDVAGVEAVAGGQTLDGTLTGGDVEKVVKLHGLTSGFHAPILKEGRLPEAAAECVLDARLVETVPFRLGGKVRLRAADEDALAFSEYTVVGVADSPLYISIDRGTSTLGDGSVAGFVLLPEDGFALDYFTVLYVRAAGAAALDPYGQEYKDLTAALIERTEPVVAARAVERFAFLKTDGAEKLADGEAELAAGWAAGQATLAEAEATLAEGRNALDRGDAQLAQAKIDYDEGIRTGRALLDENRQALDDGRAALEAAASQLALGRAGLELRRSLYDSETAAAYQAVVQAEAEAGRKQAALAEAKARAEAARQAAEAYEAALRAELEALLPPSQREHTLEGLAALRLQAEMEAVLYEGAVRALDQAQAQVTARYQELEQTQIEGLAAIAELEAQLADGEAALAAGREQLAAGETALAEGERDYERQVRSGAKALAEAEEELTARRAEYEQGLRDLETGKAEAQSAYDEARAKLDRAAEKLRTLRPAETYVLDRGSNYGFVSYDQNAQRMENLAKMFPIIFYLVAALVCLTTMTRMVNEQRTQIGAIKALGYGTGAIAGKYLIYGALAALLGSIFGAAVGTVLFPAIIFVSYQILYVLPALELRVYWGLCLAATGVGLAVTLGAITWAMASTARQTPAALLRPKAPKAGKRILLERIGPLWRRMTFSMKVSARNLFRYKKRLLMTIIGVAGCTGLLIAGLGLHSSIFDILDVQFFDLYQYDISVTLDTDSPGAADRVEALLEGRTEVESWAGVFSRSVTFSANGKSVEGYLSVTADPAALEKQIRLRDMDTKQPVFVPDSGVLIDLKLSELLELDPGDEFSVDLGRPTPIRVVSIREHYVYHYAMLTQESYEALTGETPAENELLISLREPDDEAISDLCRALMQIEGVRSAVNKNAMARDFRKTMEVVDMAVMIIVLSAAALAFVVLYNLTNINVTERIRELATIKVLGFYDGEVAMYIYRENLVLTVIGIALGQVFGKYLCAFLIRTVEMDIVMFGRDPQLGNYLLSIVLSLLFAALVNWAMFYRMKKIDMVQALKSVE